MIPFRIAAAIFGVALVFAALGSAVRAVVLPRAVQGRLARWVFRFTRVLFRVMAGQRTSYDRRDKTLAMYAPVSLLMLVLVWELCLFVGFTAIYWAMGIEPLSRAVRVSGSSLFTLGTDRAQGLAASLTMFAEAALGLLVLALLITFLPSLYAAFSKRESMVALLESRAGAPPSVVEMITRYFRIHGLGELKSVWTQWEIWFAEVEESHTSYPALAFFRSPQAHHSWVTSAGAVLDTAAFRASTLDLDREPEAELCIRAGYIALRRIAYFFGIPYDPDPAPDDPISISRQEYEDACRILEDRGVPLRKDRDQTWKDFAGWRVNYDSVLLALAGFVTAPEAPWSSDRAHEYWRYPLFSSTAVPRNPR